MKIMRYKLGMFPWNHEVSFCYLATDSDGNEGIGSTPQRAMLDLRHEYLNMHASRDRRWSHSPF